MRWLLLKDLQIMRRSPLITALLVIYPIALAVLIGFALSRGPEDPRVAFLNLVPEGDAVVVGGDQDFTGGDAKGELCERVECVDVSTREEAVEKVTSGEVLGALILPDDLAAEINSLQSIDPRQPTVEVLVNEDDPVKAQFVDDRISSLLAEANLRISNDISQQSINYLDVLLAGGDFNVLGRSFQVLGLERSEELLRGLRGVLPPGSSERRALDRVLDFADLAIENLGLADDLLTAVSQPVLVDKQVVGGAAPPLDIFAISIAATVTLMFVTVLLVAGSLALEREENAFARLTRGLVGPAALLTEKIALGIAVSLAVTLLMLGGLEAFVELDWSRFVLIVAAIVAGGAAFAAFGAALGGAAREVRAASLLAFMVSLPIAFISLVPSGTVSATLFDLIGVIAAAFPFDPAQRAISAGLDSAGPSLGAAIGHLAALTLAYAALGRLALRRF